MCASLYCAMPRRLPHEYLIAALSCHVHQVFCNRMPVTKNSPSCNCEVNVRLLIFLLRLKRALIMFVCLVIV